MQLLHTILVLLLMHNLKHLLYLVLLSLLIICLIHQVIHISPLNDAVLSDLLEKIDGLGVRRLPFL